jgi:MFS family permease
MSGSVARAREALRSPDFARLLQARLLSQFGDGIFQAFLIDRLVFLNPDQQGTAAGVARAFAVLIIPFSIVGPLAGVLIDRWSRRRILLATPLIRAACALTLIPLHGDGWILYVPTLVVVSLNRFYLSTAGAVMPLVVGETDLLVANSLASAAGTVCTFAGLVLGTQVAGAAGDGILLVAVTVMWPVAAWLATRIAHDLHSTSTAGVSQDRLSEIPRDLWRGARRLLATPPAMGGIVSASFDQLLFGIVSVLSVVVFKQQFHEGVASYGRIIAAGGAGVLAGMLTVGWLENRLPKSRIVAVAFAVGGVACLVVAPAIDSVTILLLSFALGLSYPWRKIPIDTMVQETIPDRFRGRVFSLYDLAFSGARVLAALIAVALVPRLSTAELLAVVGAGYLAWTPVLPLWASRPQRIDIRFLAGGRADETPRSVVIGGEVEPVEVLSRRLEDRGSGPAPGFRLRTPDGVIDVRREPGAGRWTIERANAVGVRTVRRARRGASSEAG